MQVKNIIELVARKSGKQPRTNDDAALGPLADLLEHPDIASYLRCCVPGQAVGVSGVRLLPLEDIHQEMSQGSAPGSFIRRYGYVVVATSVGGNAICFHSPSGKVFWADHVSFAADSISYKDRATGEWKYLYEYAAENVKRALVPLSDNIESFLEALLTDRLEAQLDALD